MDLTRNHEVSGSIPGLTQWINYPALLWLWRRLADVAPIRHLAWGSPYATGAALKKGREKEKKKKGKETCLFPLLLSLMFRQRISFTFWALSQDVRKNQKPSELILIPFSTFLHKRLSLSHMGLEAGSRELILYLLLFFQVHQDGTGARGDGGRCKWGERRSLF